MFCTGPITPGIFPGQCPPLVTYYERRGKLPYTVGKSASDYAAQIISTGSGIVSVPYNEGLFIDYRHFDQVCKLLPDLTTVSINYLRRPASSLDSSSDLVCLTRHSTIPTWKYLDRLLAVPVSLRARAPPWIHGRLYIFCASFIAINLRF